MTHSNYINVTEYDPYKTSLYDYPDASLIDYSGVNKDNDNIVSVDNIAVIICPGGGYMVRSDGEAFPIAQILSNQGYRPFILNYSIGEENPFPIAFRELAWSVNYLKENSRKYDINSEKIIILGLSAGGHLAGCLNTYWHSDWIHSYDFPLDCEPYITALSYPVTGQIEAGNMRTFSTLEANIDIDLVPYLYLNKNINVNIPPTFIWQNEDDPVVPIKSTFDYIKGLKELDIPFEAHFYTHGGHNPFRNDSWFDPFFQWLRKNGA